MIQTSWTDAELLDGRIAPRLYQADLLRAYASAHERGIPMKPLGSVCERVYDGNHGGLHPSEFYDTGPLFIRNSYFNDFHVTRADHLSNADYDSLRPALKGLETGDVLCAIKGDVGRAALYLGAETRATVNPPTACCRPGPQIRGGFLAALFESTFFKSQIVALASSKSTRPEVSVSEFRELLVLLPNDDLQLVIHNKVMKALHLKERSRKFLNDAREILAGELYLVEQRERDVHAVRPETSWVNPSNITHRIDSWYFRPTFEAIDAIVEKLDSEGVSIERLGAFAQVDYGYMPTEDYWAEDEGATFLRTTNFSDDLATDLSDVKYVNPSAKDSPKHTLLAGDVLVIQCGNNTGRICYVGPNLSHWVYPSFSLRIRATDCDPAYLALLLDSDFGQLQIQKEISITSVRPNTTKPAVKSLRIPVLPDDTQKTIGDLVRKSDSQRSQVSAAVNDAISAVESLVNGTLDEPSFLAEGDELSAWLESNPLPESSGDYNS